MASCITGPYDPVHRPRVSDSLDYEGELGIVISRRCRHVPRDRALEVVAGYVVVNDLTVREWVTLTPQVVVPKSFDTHGPRSEEQTAELQPLMRNPSAVL